jgi:histidine phosphotransferase ChpT
VTRPISPIGAIHNGIELIMTSRNDKLGPGFDLIAESSNNAANRIKFFRIAFGHTHNNRKISSQNALSIAYPAISVGRRTLNWQLKVDLSPLEVQVLFLSILRLETAMPKGGHLHVKQSGHGYSVTVEKKYTH